MKYPNFCGGAYSTPNSTNLDEQTINLFPALVGSPGAKARVELHQTPGVTSLASAGLSVPGRACAYVLGRLFAVFGAHLYEISSAWALTLRATVAVVDGSPASLACNGDGAQDLLVVSGGKAYHFAMDTNTSTEVIAADAVMGLHVGGYFFVLMSNGDVRASDHLDGSTFPALATAQRATASDSLVALGEAGNLLWMLGSETSEVWEDAAQRLFPFVPHPSGQIDIGCAAPWSVKKVDDRLFWLSRTSAGIGAVVSASGFTVEPVSPPGLDQEIQEYGTVDDAIGDAYAQNGHTFYVLTFPTAGVTWVYDLTTQQWHRRGEWDEMIGAWTAWRPLYHAFAFDTHVVLDYLGNGLYALDPTGSEDVEGRPIRRLRRAAVLASEQTVVTFPGLQLDMRTGVGTVAEPSPVMTLNISDNGGRTWRVFGDAPIGAQGEYDTRVRWRRLGAARNRVFEVVTASKVPIYITDAIINPVMGAH